ncbi:nucleoside-diphosphate-sugar epimerase [Litorimonas taeanensis]|uniref:Nucleoside-diphosphate-sugar epimerase n=1 Tax=Litorimonas taeanensis TaxID=568099 RepID=A0A420WFQ2_9PROT|nr:SDR family oxidoreductase [Litorimonas taeanensis]RKQ69789.1 nucleoside-diphosphate-sugar epimerase [Litorimonas taeanensis]
MGTRINLHTGKAVSERVERPVALLLGAGYTARALAPVLTALGYSCVGTTRTPAEVKALEANNIAPIVSQSLASSEISDCFEKAEIIISSIPPCKSPDANGVYDPVVAQFGSLRPRAKWLAYLSATSVYGDRQGLWAFEGEPANPQLKRGKARAEAELEWLETLWPVHIFRLAGLYGQGRAPFSKLKSGTARAVIKDGHVVNRIYIDDCVSAIIASISRPNPQRIYNIADGHPAPPQDVLDYAAKLIGVDSPPRVGLEDETVSDMARTFYSETKRIDISRAKLELSWMPKYTDYKAGLRAILEPCTQSHDNKVPEQNIDI